MKLNSIERAFMNNPVRAAHQHHREAAWFKRLAGGDLSGQHVLEVGCGQGVGAEVILDRLGAANVTAFDLDEATRLALKNRPELDQIRLQTEQKNIDIAYYKSQTKPQIDLVGSYGDIGLAGTPSSVVSSTTGQPLGANVLSRFKGGYFQALNNLFTQDYKTYQFGIHFSFPWRNRTAEGNLGRSLAEARQLDARQRQLVETVQVDVRNALQAVVASAQRLEAAKAAEAASLAQYNGEQERYRAGLSTNFVVLQRLTDLSVAKGNTVRALTDYNKALADLQRVTGMTLVSNNVQVSSPAGGDK